MVKGGICGEGVCMAKEGGMRGKGGMHGKRGACVVKGGVCREGGHAWQRGECMVKGGMRGIHTPPLQDMVGQCAGVRILLECILVIVIESQYLIFSNITCAFIMFCIDK